MTKPASQQFSWTFALALLVLCACDVQPGESKAQAPVATQSASLFAAAPGQQWPLPRRLREISGLALAPNGRLFAHNDEHAVVYQLDIDTGRIVKTFSLNAPNGHPVHGDFESIAVTDSGDFYMLTSTGILYRFREGEDGANVAFTTADTDLSAVCEIEGLAFDRAEDSLIIACKVNYQHGMRHHIALYAWSLHDRQVRPWRRFPAAPLAAAIGADAFHPSEITFDPQSHRMILLSGRERGMVELASDGTLLASRSLAALHRQPEGAAVLRDGSLAIADEGAAGAHAQLTRYARVHD